MAKIKVEVVNRSEGKSHVVVSDQFILESFKAMTIADREKYYDTHIVPKVKESLEKWVRGEL